MCGVYVCGVCVGVGGDMCGDIRYVCVDKWWCDEYSVLT